MAFISIKQRALVKHFFSFGFTLKQLLLFIMSGLLTALSMPPYGMSFLIFIALIPALLAVKDIGNAPAFRLGVIAGIALYGLSLKWLFTVFGFFAITLIFILALFWGIFFLILNMIRRRFGLMSALVMLPVIWTAVEFFRSELWVLKFGWLALGYSQYRSGIFLTAAAFIGVYGVGLIIAAVNGVLAMIIVFRSKKAYWLSAAILSLLSLFLLAAHKNQREGIHINTVRAYCVHGAGTLNNMMERVEAADPAPGSLICLPEYSVIDSPFNNLLLKKKVEEFARRTRSYFIFGCLDSLIFEESFNNVALLYGPSGRCLGKFQKHHPIQFFIDGKQGSGYPVYYTSAGVIGIGICYDLDYVDVARNITAKGAGLIVCPTLDNTVWHKQHAALLPFRAAETGRYIIRPAREGISMILWPDGKVLDTTGPGGSGILVRGVPFIYNKTFYVKHGYYIPYMCILAVIILLGMGLSRKKCFL